MAFELNLQANAEESPHQYDHGKNDHTVKRRLYRDRPNDISGNENLESQQDCSSYVLAVPQIGLIGLPQNVSRAADRGNDDARNDQQNTGEVHDVAECLNGVRPPVLCS